MKDYCVNCRIEIEIRIGMMRSLLGNNAIKYEDGWYCFNCARKKGWHPK